MHHFSVWAPYAHSSVVQVDGKRYQMTSAEHGWWHAGVADAGHGSEYGFLLDDDPKLYPDPQSLWQPDGLHAPSRVFDHSRFVWRDGNWFAPPLSKAVIYELHVGTFTPEGTFAAAAKKLPYLLDLGITHVELMPVNSFPGRWGWGYDGAALYAPQEQYGGPEALKELVAACHASGLAALLDVVYNHFGPVGNYTGKFGPYVIQSHRTPWGGAVNLEEAGSNEVRRFFCDNVLMWLRDYHFDGLRFDAIHSFVDRSAKHFLEQVSEEVESLSRESGRSYVLIAESDLNDPRVVTPRTETTSSQEGAAGGYGFDAQWSDDFHHSLFALLTGERRSYYQDFGSLSQLAKSLKSVYVYDGLYSEYRGCVHGRPVENLSAHRFLGYIQNHDQVGNRAYGDRLHEIAGLKRAKLAAAAVLTAPFVPMIFQGEEFAASSPFLYFADHEDPELARAVSEGRRKEHASDGAWDSVPDPESQDSFERSKLIWSEQEEPEHAEMLAWYRNLIRLRSSNESLGDGDLNHVKVRFDEERRWLVLERSEVHLFFNFAEEAISLPAAGESDLLLTSEPGVSYRQGAIELPALSFAAIRSPLRHK